jgi:hypothetical protein
LDKKEYNYKQKLELVRQQYSIRNVDLPRYLS